MSSGSDYTVDNMSVGDDTSLDYWNQKHAAVNEKQQQLIADKETRLVRKFKLFVLAFLAFAAIGVALCVYFYLHHQEESEFEEEFIADANKVMASIRANLELTLIAADSFATNIVATAKATNQTWPFVVIPDFGVQAAKFLSLSSAYIINLYMLVQDEQRKEFEAFMPANSGWIQQTVDIHNKDSKYNTTVGPDYFEFNVIHGYDEWEKENPGEVGIDRREEYLVWWQCYPVVPVEPIYGWDLWSSSTEEEIYWTGPGSGYKPEVDVTYPYLIAYPNDTFRQEANMLEASWIENYVPPGENTLEPVSDIYYPLLENSLEVIDVIGDGNYTPDEITTHGFLALSFYWRNMLRNILPDSSNGIVVVFDNPCAPSFTYQLDGPHENYLGDNDQHDADYDHMLIEAAMEIDLHQFSTNKTGAYSGVPLKEDCPFHIRIYPSDTKHDRYTTMNPIILAVVAGMIFVLTSATFLGYDFWVERRQKLVLNTAVRSSAIVSSLFPENVRDRMYDENQAQEDAKTDKNQFLAKEAHSPEIEGKGVPIADLFNETTVFFADLVGFTSWCDSRTPSEVFSLLETLYGEFDKVAEKRQVFKVETIGDCYMAVTGLPTPQQKHAVIMARFAADCRTRMEKVVNDLDIVFQTKVLQVRIGLHSGPVTAGVLRGKKARFQLFGDTVNTAARMESTGRPGRIQVSEATAQELRKWDKGSWLIPREETVVAKGKGEMQTYWVEPTSIANSTTRSLDDDPEMAQNHLEREKFENDHCGDIIPDATEETDWL